VLLGVSGISIFRDNAFSQRQLSYILPDVRRYQVAMAMPTNPPISVPCRTTVRPLARGVRFASLSG
jgi:hypothetical protein